MASNLVSQNNRDSLYVELSKSSNKNDSIKQLIELSRSYYNQNLDSSLLYINRALVLSENIEFSLLRCKVYFELASTYSAKGNYPASFDFYNKSLDCSESLPKGKQDEWEVKEFVSRTYNGLGSNYFQSGNAIDALSSFNNALSLHEEIRLNNPANYNPQLKARLLNNIGSVYLVKEEYKVALEYYLPAVELGKEEKSKVLLGSLYNNIGIIYKEMNNLDLALHYYLESAKVRKDIDDKKGLAQTYNNIGNYYIGKGDYNQAISYLLQAYKYGKSVGVLSSIRYSSQFLAEAYEKNGNFKEAVEEYKMLMIYNDSLKNEESISRIANLENQLAIAKINRNHELEIQQQNIAREKNELIYVIIGGSLALLLIIAILFVFYQRAKIGHSRLEKEHLQLEADHLNLEKQKLNEKLEFKNRELTTNVMYLLKKNELITNISEKLIKSKFDFKKENQKIVQDIINELQSNQDKDTWEEFEVHFTQVHTDFYKKLNDLFPNLTNNEKKLCAFLKLNMSTKDIAAITYQSINSITVARSRLRKKLNIEGDDVGLVNFLSQF